MEKLDVLLWGDADRARLLSDVAPRLLALPGVRGVTVQIGDTQDDVPRPSILLGSGAGLGALVQLWVASYDGHRDVTAVLAPAAERLDAYLVSESEPQPIEDRDWPNGEQSPGISHVTWFPKPERLSEEDFLHGWHEVHTPHSAALHPRRWTYVRDTVVRALTPGSPPLRAIVVERFRELVDYTDPARLFGGEEAFAQNMQDLPGYADLDDISSRPMHELVLRTP